MTTQALSLDFTSFVFAQGDEIKTTSLIIAEKFSKQHKHVLRDIEKIMMQVSDIFGKTNFGLSEYEQPNNLGLMTKYKMYELTKDGFIMVVMSYTGAKAFAIKEAYINAFNLMHAKLFPKTKSLTPQTPAGFPELLNARMTAQQKIMMLILASRADENGQCQISITDLAPLCGIERSTTSKNLTDLVEAGFLTVIKKRYEHGGSQPNIYTIPERFRVVSGELVDESVASEYMTPEGMVLIAENELETLRHKANTKALPPPAQKVEPIPAGCVVLTLKEYDAFKKLDDIVSGIRFALNY